MTLTMDQAMAYNLRKIAVLAVLLALMAPAGPAFGQGRPRRVDPSRTVPPPGRQADVPDASGPIDDDNEPVMLEGSLVEVPVVVADRTGHYVPRLRKDDFRVLEDGRPQQITFFSTDRVPIHVALVVDTSGSTRQTLPDIQEAAISFINQLEPGDKVMVVSFASEVIVEQEFTSDRSMLARAVRRTQSQGSTRLYDAVYLTVAERLRHVDGRKAMVILSDGEDQHSKDVTFDEAVMACNESDISVYGIRYPESSAVQINRPGGGSPFPVPGGRNPGTYPPTQPRRRGGGGGRIRIPGLPRIPGVTWPLQQGSPVSFATSPQWNGRQWPGGGRVGRDPFMETITSESGGTLFYAGAVRDVNQLFATIAEELRSVYIIGYSTSNPLSSGGYRKITVQVPSRPDLAIRHRLGYHADTYKK